MLKSAQRVPLATYRLQLRKEFPFAAVGAAARHLARLGVSDCYFSPILSSNPGSTHGYDVTDYRRIDAELGGRDGLYRLNDTLKEAGLGILLDFVPNHMGINGPGPFNAWWQNVLENGEESQYARFFDINWARHRGRRQVLVPILDDHYGRVLEAGRLSVVEDRGALSLAFGDMRFPLSAESYGEILRGIAGIDPVGTDLGRFKQHLAEVLQREPRIRGELDGRLRQLNGTKGDARSYDMLDTLIERQHYRLSYWKAGAHETNYRRFFAIDSLIGVRIELPEVFNECHALLGRLLRDKVVAGVRIDHIDGLWDPAGYLERLQQLAQSEGVGGDLFVVVEKILHEGEPMPAGWRAHGTTGYEFIAQLAGLMVNRRLESEFTEIYADFTGEKQGYAATVSDKKRMILDEMFANAVDGLAESLRALPETDRRWRDLTQSELTVAIRDIMANLSVYRTYRRGADPMNDSDRREIERAAAEAARRNPRMSREAFEFVRDVLVGGYPGNEFPAELRAYAGRWTMTFQQYTGAVTAKAVEDTAFYTYNRLIGLNEVGCDPDVFGRNLDAFHAANAERAASSPHCLLATSTHDTKLGEDARARLYALSEIPHEWREWLAEWRAANRRHKSLVDGQSAPDANEEYRLYQALLAAWEPGSDTGGADFSARMKEYARKAVNEAKQHTSWSNQNEAWLEAGDRFIDGILDPARGKEFLESFRPKAARLAQLGMVNSLAQVALKTLSPGIPDFYQGAESWLFHLVDPDNRRLIDFDALARLEDPTTDFGELLHAWADGRIKYRITRALLEHRRANAALFRGGDYLPLATAGRHANHVVAFARSHPGGATTVVVVPRLTSRLGCPPLGLVWDDTTVKAPARARWRDVVTGREFGGEGELPLRSLFCELPLAVLA